MFPPYPGGFFRQEEEIWKLKMLGEKFIDYFTARMSSSLISLYYSNKKLVHYSLGTIFPFNIELNVVISLVLFPTMYV